jgi:hypothetical protein
LGLLSTINTDKIVIDTIQWQIPRAVSHRPWKFEMDNDSYITIRMNRKFYTLPQLRGAAVVLLTILLVHVVWTQDQVWFTPNGASIDMLELFTNPDQWDSARSKIDVFKFDAGHVGTAGWSCTVIPSDVCGVNHIENFIDVQAFVKVGQWGLDLAVESFFAGPIMSLDPVVCSTGDYVHSLTLNGSVNVIQSIESNGGTVRYLAMDEPLGQWLPEYYYIYTGQPDPRPCRVDSIGRLADYMAAYILQMQSWFPSVPIGQIDLYPEVSVGQFKEWILALEARGVSLPFLHLDVHGIRIDSYREFGLDIDVAADLAELKSFLESRGTALGIIYSDIYWDSRLWGIHEYNDSTYYNSTMDWIRVVDSMGVIPDHHIFQSWVAPYYDTGRGPNEIPVNLPEADTSVFSHTRLILEGLERINPSSAVTINTMMSAGWNLLSLPVGVEESDASSIYPAAVSDPFIFDGSYSSRSDIPRGTGFWLKYDTATLSQVSGSPTLLDSVDVHPGWNIVGSISGPVATGSIVSIPGGIIASPFIGHNEEYFAADTIRPGMGYWVKVTSPGRLILSSDPVAPVGRSPR